MSNLTVSESARARELVRLAEQHDNHYLLIEIAALLRKLLDMPPTR
jgi:hypothetical protein